MSAPIAIPVCLAAGLEFNSEIFTLLAIIVGLAILLGIIAAVLRKKLLSEDEQPQLGFTLRDLREMHAQGQLSDEELAAAEEKAKARQRSLYLGEDAGTENTKQANTPAADETADEGGSESGSDRSEEASESGGTENDEQPPDKNRGDGVDG